MDQGDLLEITADIVAAHVANNNVAVGDLSELIRGVHDTLRSLDEPAPAVEESRTPAVSVRSSVRPDHIACLECGAKLKTLRRHLRTAHGLTREQYRELYGLPATYPLTSSNYSQKRSVLAKSAGLGRKKGESPRGRKPA